jgi:hypothetical protein
MTKFITVDSVNAILIIMTAVAAFLWPFEVFLFAYAFFGPLHYLTEISWLEKRNFFVVNKYFVWFLVFIGVVLFILHLQIFVVAPDVVFLLAAVLIAAAYMLALLYAAQWSLWQRRMIIGLVIGVMLGTLVLQSWAIFFAILLPTVIHVSVFTLLFMIYGAQKSGQRMGYVNVYLYICATVALVYCTVEGNNYSLSAYITEAYRSFEGVNLQIMNLLNIGNADIQWSIYESAAGLSIMRFIAFAYTYHYLNWFSKVNVINWYAIGQTRMVFVVCAWVGAVVLYIVNYQAGLFVLFFLSMVHVLLEFPLNQQSLLGIWSHTKQSLRIK